MKFLTAVTLLIILFTLAVSSKAEEQNEYRHILILGIDKPLSNSDVNTPSPVFAYYYIREDLENDLYFKISAATTTAGFIIGQKTDSFFTGIKPVINHTVYGAYHSYSDGVNNDGRCFKGNNSGAEIFFENTALRYFKSGIRYYPGYYWYQNKKKSKTIFAEQDATEIDLPRNHIEHTGVFDIAVANLVKKDLDRIRQGFILQGTYKYSYRSGYKTFYDTASAGNSSIKKTQKLYLSGGFYYILKHEINLLLDITGTYNRNTDRNNADQIGSYIADQGVMPGYYWGEFYHNRYSVARAQIGAPLGFWDARLQPGFNILYMTRDNDVAGMDNYPRRIYRSVSAGLSLKAGGILPVFINYAYGLDACRLNTRTGVVKKGSNELMFYVLSAF